MCKIALEAKCSSRTRMKNDDSDNDNRNKDDGDYDDDYDDDGDDDNSGCGCGLLCAAAICRLFGCHNSSRARWRGYCQACGALHFTGGIVRLSGAQASGRGS